MTGLTAFCAISVANAQSVWVVPSLARVGQTDAPGTGTTAQLYAAKGEWESFQIAVHATSQPVTIENVTVSALTGPATIPASALTVYREFYVSVPKGQTSPIWEPNVPLGPGNYADALIPFVNPLTGASLINSGATYEPAPYKLAANTNQPFWVDVQVPRTAPAGIYSGTYTVTTSTGGYTGTIDLTVWNFSLPVQPYLRSSFQINVATYMQAYELMLDNRLDGDADQDYPSTAQQTLLQNTYGMNDVDLGFYSGAEEDACDSMPGPPSKSELTSAINQQIKGPLLYDFSADETDGCTGIYPMIIKWGAALHAVGVDQLITMAPVPALFSDGTGSGRSAVDIWVLGPWDDWTYVDEALAKGDKVWSYNCEVQDGTSPKWEIDFPPIDWRIQPGFINQSLGLTGLLYWAIDNWNSDPWTNVTYHDGGETFAGDGFLVYPGKQVGVANAVVPSMRLKWLRDGVDDYDYIQLLKNAGYGSWALSVTQSVGASWSNWTKDPTALEAARQELGEKLNSLAQ